MSSTAVPGTTSVGWIGTGVMGASMCRNLLSAGYELHVHTRTTSKAAPLLELGAHWSEGPEELAAGSDVVFTMVGYPHDVEALYFGAEGRPGLIASARAGAVLVDMTTSSPDLAVAIAERAEASGLSSLDAPVTGGDLGARNGTLSIMVGGDPAAFEAVHPCLAAMGTTIVHHGGPGTGQHAKLVNQTLVASTMVAMAEGLLYAQESGLDVEQVLTSVASGAAGSWALSNLAPRVLQGDFAPGFFVDHFVKDLGLALHEADRRGLELPGLALAHRLYVALQEQGRGKEGTQAIVHAVAAMSGKSWHRLV